jgi:membrane-associated phospholipid phosphatase
MVSGIERIVHDGGYFQMAHEREMAGEIFAAQGLDSRGHAIGRLISRIFHPILMNVVAFLIVGYFALETPSAGLWWAGVCMLLQVLPPTIFFTIRARQGAYVDEDVSVRQQRNELYLFGLVTVLIGLALLILLGAPQAFLALLVCGLALGVLGGVINLFWKISIHAASIASTATVALLFSRSLGVALWLCALAVAWARVRTRNHTPLQVLAGFTLAVLIVLMVFSVFALE